MENQYYATSNGAMSFGPCTLKPLVVEDPIKDHLFDSMFDMETIADASTAADQWLSVLSSLIEKVNALHSEIYLAKKDLHSGAAIKDQEKTQNAYDRIISMEDTFEAKEVGMPDLVAVAITLRDIYEEYKEEREEEQKEKNALENLI